MNKPVFSLHKSKEGVLKREYNSTNARKHMNNTKIEAELGRLRKLLGLELDFEVIWEPNAEKSVEGEIKGRNIFIYEADESKALNILRHELIDFLVSQAIEPYKDARAQMPCKIHPEMVSVSPTHSSCSDYLADLKTGK